MFEYVLKLCAGDVTIKKKTMVYAGIGIGQMVSTCYVSTYYMTLMAIALRFMFASFHAQLPWAECNGWWQAECEANRTVTAAEYYFV